MTSRSKYKVALAGFGLAGSVFHAPFIQRTAGLELAAIVTSDAERIKQAKAEYPDAKIYARADEVFSSSADYDLFVVAAPNKYHYSLCHDALRSGLHVVVDKPAATSSTEVSELISLSHSEKKLFTVYQNRRWDADFLTLQRVIAREELGKLTRFESRFERYRPSPKKEAWRESGDRTDAGGLLFDLGSHLIDQACVLFGRPESVYAEVRTLRQNALVDDDVFLALQFKADVVAHLWASSVASSPAPRFRLYGLAGSYEKFGLDPQEDALRAGKRPGTADWGREDDSSWGYLYRGTANGVVKERIASVNGAYQNFYVNLAAALAGQASLAVRPEEALVTTAVIQAAFKSSRNHRVEQLTLTN
jgi:predicted dehydrogenase